MSLKGQGRSAMPHGVFSRSTPNSTRRPWNLISDRPQREPSPLRTLQLDHDSPRIAMASIRTRVGASAEEIATEVEVSGQTMHDEEERQYLARALRLLAAQLKSVTASIESSAGALDESKKLMWENRRDMDGAEKAALRTMLDVAVQQGENTVAARGRLTRLLDTPYFGRVDFQLDHQGDHLPYYIGVHGPRDPDTGELLVYDWRAPVSSLYYDFESGEAFFDAPEGAVHGEITGERQYKITDGRMQYVLETTLNIGDDILQQELNRSADDKMKSIVATIQREQNAIIRNETAHVLILQGVAGSGKTSIALHRVASGRVPGRP